MVIVANLALSFGIAISWFNSKQFLLSTI